MKNQKHSEVLDHDRNDRAEAAARRWFCRCLSILAGLLILTGLVVVVVDPYFHYHKPFSFLSYRLYEERYINDGISRHFDFDAMITGTSMAQNFSPVKWTGCLAHTLLRKPSPVRAIRSFPRTLSVP